MSGSGGESGGWGNWQGKADACPFAGGAFGGDGTAVSGDDGFDDGEAEAASSTCWGGGGAGAINFIKSLENVGQVLWVDAASGIADTYGQHPAFWCRTHGNRAVNRRVPAGVVQQVEQYLGD